MEVKEISQSENVMLILSEESRVYAAAAVIHVAAGGSASAGAGLWGLEHTNFVHFPPGLKTSSWHSFFFQLFGGGK